MAIKDGFIVKNGNRSGFPAVPPASAIPYDVNTNVKDKIDTKADASAVKNEFLGTLEEWDALTTAEKKAYDTYQITNDFTGGSGLPNYSTTEQKTGQKWIDGKDIYQKTIDFGTLPNTSSKQVATGLTNVKVRKIDAISRRSSDGFAISIPHATTGGVQYQVSVNYSNGNIDISAGTDMTAFDETYVTLQYTKA